MGWGVSLKLKQIMQKSDLKAHKIIPKKKEEFSASKHHKNCNAKWF